MTETFQECVPERFEAGRLPVLFGQYLAGDFGAANQFASLVHPLLLAYFRNRTGRWREAEDLAQECWARIHVGRAGFRGGMPVLPWIYGVARHTLLDAYRRNRLRLLRETTLVGEWDCGDQSQPDLDARLYARSIFDRMSCLTGQQREVFMLYYLEEKSQEEVSRIVGCSAAAVKQKVFRARAALRSALDQ